MNTTYSPLCLLLFLTISSNATALPSVVRHDNGPGNCNPRMFSVSSDAPMTRFLNTHVQDIPKHIGVIVDFISFIEKAIHDQLATGLPPSPDSLLHTCNFRTGLAEGVRHNIVHGNENRHLPIPDASCLTDHVGPAVSRSTIGKFTAGQVFHALQARGDLITKNILGLAQSAMGNYSAPAFIYNFPYSTTSKTCVLHVAGGIRVDEDWYIRTQLTDVPIFAHVPKFGRQYLAELIRIGRNGSLGWPLVQGWCDEGVNNGPRRWRNDSTTITNNRRGHANPAFLHRILPKDNPAIHEALQKSEYSIRQATDTLFPSNVAILVLPLALNLMPLALITDVNTFTMLMYALLSDVLTALPLMIKGIELINVGTKRHYSVFTRMSSSSDGTYSRSSRCEVWSAECHSKRNVAVAGKFFIAVAIIFIVGGLCAEVAAHRYRSRGRSAHTRQTKELVFESLLRSTRRSEEKVVLLEDKNILGANHNGIEGESYESLANWERPSS